MRLPASHPWPRRWLYACLAALLSAGAPFGLLVVRGAGAGRASPAWARDQIAGDAALFVYVTLSTLSVFLAFGYVLGRHADRLLALSETDPLTGLYNARAFAARLEAEIARARRYRHALSLLFIDVDGLKAINDRGGHLAGDAALVRVATALRSAARGTDLAARWGGDEFALLAPDTTAAAALTVGERIRALVSEPPDDAAAAITVSVGLATTAGEEGATAEQLRARADAALYAAKRQGRDRVVGAGPDDFRGPFAVLHRAPPPAVEVRPRPARSMPGEEVLNRVGFWSAVIVAGAATAFDVAVLASRFLAPPWDVVGALVPSLVLAPAFLALVVSVHSSVPEPMRAWTRLAAAFAAVYVPLTTSAYVVELAVVEPLVLRGQGDRAELLTLTRMDSVFNAVDGLGYAFMSLAAVFAGRAFEGGRLERWIRRLLIATGLLAVPILLTYFVDRGFLYAAALWGLTVPGAGILLAVYFRRRG